MLGHSNSWPEAVLGRFNTVLTPRLFLSAAAAAHTQRQHSGQFSAIPSNVYQNRGHLKAILNDYNRFEAFLCRYESFERFQERRSCERCEGRC